MPATVTRFCVRCGRATSWGGSLGLYVCYCGHEDPDPPEVSVRGCDSCQRHTTSLETATGWQCTICAEAT